MTQSYGKISVAQIRIDYLPCYIFFVVFVPKSVGLEWFVVPKSVLKIVMVVPKNVFVADFQEQRALLVWNDIHVCFLRNCMFVG